MDAESWAFKLAYGLATSGNRDDFHPAPQLKLDLGITMYSLVCLAYCLLNVPRQTIPTNHELSYGFGTVDFSLKLADILWCDRLVYPITFGYPRRAQELATDLLRRLDRPVVRVALRGEEPKYRTTPEEDLTLGISYWTLQWKASSEGVGDESKFHSLAQRYLFKASHEGDAVQRSFAALAYAYCATRTIGDFEDRNLPAGFPNHNYRTKQFRQRLTHVYETFKQSVPERSLRAAYEIAQLDLALGDKEAFYEQRKLIHREFATYKNLIANW
ncbi:hypothetical protein [Fimbriimonas ginsengisoli]|uniref:hypothetical protein n=1 Tax=Fimbriimonas ginsengisoli TaxID=1005039 RepID=UPI00046D71E8|nr:hypothetical protein [Fimbriimonas ginsengisoli]